MQPGSRRLAAPTSCRPWGNQIGKGGCTPTCSTRRAHRDHDADSVLSRMTRASGGKTSASVQWTQRHARPHLSELHQNILLQGAHVPFLWCLRGRLGCRHRRRLWRRQVSALSRSRLDRNMRCTSVGGCEPQGGSANATSTRGLRRAWNPPYHLVKLGVGELFVVFARCQPRWRRRQRSRGRGRAGRA